MTLVFLRESLPKQGVRKIIPLVSLLPTNFVVVLWRGTTNRRVGLMLLLAWTAAKGAYFAISLFGKEAFDWDSYDQAVVFSLLGGVAGLFCMVMPKLLHGRLSDFAMTAVASMLLATGFLLWTIATLDESLVYLGVAFLGTGTYLTPVMRGILSKANRPDQQGTILGAAAGLEVRRR